MPKVTTKKTTKEVAPKTEKGEKTVSIDVLDAKGIVTGKMDLPAAVFAGEVNDTLVAQAVRVYLANQRKGTASTKTRGQVAISTRKIYRQKGTGNARHGAKSAPIFVGGGVAHGPHPREFSLSLSQKMKSAALVSALSAKYADKKIVVVDGLSAIEPRTKTMAALFKTLAKDTKKTQRVMLVVGEEGTNVKRAARNIAGVTLRVPQTMNTYEVLHNHVVIFMKDTIDQLEKRLS